MESPEKSQGSIGYGILFISLGMVCVVIIIMGFLTAKSSNDGMSLLIPLGLAALFCFSIGIYGLDRGIEKDPMQAQQHTHAAHLQHVPEFVPL